MRVAAIYAGVILILSAALGLKANAEVLPAEQASGVSPEKAFLVRQIIEASGGQQQTTQLLKTVFQGANDAVLKNLPPDQRRLQSAIQNDIQSEIIAIVPDLLDATAKVYADNLSEKELRDYLGWLQSDSGQSIKSKLPAISRETLQIVMPKMLALMPNVLQRAVQRACEQAGCTAQDREVIAAAVAKALPKPQS